MKSGAPRGMRNGNATIPFDQIEQARKEWNDRLTMQRLADKYGVKKNTMINWLRYNSRVEC